MKTPRSFNSKAGKMASQGQALGPFLKDVWLLVRPYFHSEERRSAWLLLVAVVALNLLLVGLDVMLNFWNGAFYNSLQDRDWAAFIGLQFFYRRTPEGFFGIMPGFAEIAVVYIFTAVYRTYLNQWLQIRWRHWMTRRFVDAWLTDHAYYHISLTASAHHAGTDNPDQRIADDIRNFVADTLTLGLDLLSNVVSLISFVVVLWSLSGPMVLLGIRIPGYMVWVALLYALLGTGLTHMVGNPLALLNFQQQRYEADFRFGLVRLRENAEGVALYAGEGAELAGLRYRFASVIDNWWRIMQRTKLLNTLVSSYSQIAIVFPIIVAAPRYFAGQIELGGLTRTAGAFGQVQTAMSWFVSSYVSLATWRAEAERLATFRRAVLAAQVGMRAKPKLRSTKSRDLHLNDITISLPEGKVLIANLDLTFRRLESTVISGKSGSGKSTLFRAIAGIWPFGSGGIARPEGRYLFLPPRSYFPLGTLRLAVAYPNGQSSVDGARVIDVLQQSGLAHLVGRLDEEANWTQQLSSGEQQRLAIARALLSGPDWLFLDEATAALDPEGEAELYATIRRRLPKTTIVSIAHRQSVIELHQRHLVLAAKDDEPARLIPVSDSTVGEAVTGHQSRAWLIAGTLAAFVKRRRIRSQLAAVVHHVTGLIGRT
jgi:vitamin B12/bleomycin/antimicrobial peptide transport system ATP-binding/permease protein